jgi:hypothetical protein
VLDLDWPSSANDLLMLTSTNGAYRLSSSGNVETFTGIGYPTGYFRGLTATPGSPSSACGMSTYGGLVCTADYGRDWSITSLNLNSYVNIDLDRVPGAPDIMWVATETGLLRSTDGRLFELASATSGARISRVIAVSQDVALYSQPDLRRYDWPSSNYTVIDTGACFLTRTLDGSLWYDRDCSGNLQRSVDSGVTFASFGPGGTPATGVAVDVTQPERIVVAYEKGLVISHDDGATWSFVDAPFPPESLAIDPTSGDVYVGTNYGGVFRYVE